MRVIDADVVGATMAPRLLVEAMRDGHRAGVMGPVERLLLETGRDAAALTWAGSDPERGIAVKTATVFSSNASAGRLPNVQSVVVLFDGRDGRPLAAIHGESFTRMKTAASSALAADILARDDVDTLAVLGAGAQAETQIRFYRAVRPSIRRVLVWNRTPATAERLAAALSDSGLDATAVTDAAAAVREAGVVACLTAATAPVLRGAWLLPGTHVDLVGGYTPTMRESDDEVVRRGRLFAELSPFRRHDLRRLRRSHRRRHDRGGSCRRRPLRIVLGAGDRTPPPRRDHGLQERWRRSSRPDGREGVPRRRHAGRRDRPGFRAGRFSLGVQALMRPAKS